MLRRKFPVLMSAACLVLGLVAATPWSAAAEAAASCSGGPIAPGTYDSLVIRGFCFPAGDVIVTHDVTVVGGGILAAIFGGSTLTIEGNLEVRSGGAAAVGCEPKAFPCFTSPGSITNDSIGGNLIANNALLVLMHHDRIGGNVEEHSGGGGLTCAPLSGFGPGGGPPPYSTYEDDTIGGNASVTDMRTCWLGFFRNTVGNVEWHNNQTLDPDGNEIASNFIRGNLDCSANTPPPQLGDAIFVGNGPNTVGGRSTGQCPPVVIPT